MNHFQGYYTKLFDSKVAEEYKDIYPSESGLFTYGGIFDWLMDRGYCIYIAPVSTFASANHNAWWWELYVYDINDAYEKREYSDTDMYGKWHECADAAIKKAFNLIRERIKDELR